MAEFIGSNEEIVDVGDPVFFENKTDSDYEVSAGIIFKKSGVYEVSIVGNRTCVTKVPERKSGKWIYPLSTTKMIRECSECKTRCGGGLIPFKFCPNCGSYNGGEQTNV